MINITTQTERKISIVVEGKELGEFTIRDEHLFKLVTEAIDMFHKSLVQKENEKKTRCKAPDSKHPLNIAFDELHDKVFPDGYVVNIPPAILDVGGWGVK